MGSFRSMVYSLTPVPKTVVVYAGILKHQMYRELDLLCTWAPQMPSCTGAPPFACNACAKSFIERPIMTSSRYVTVHFRLSRNLGQVNLAELQRVHRLHTFKLVPDKSHSVIRFLGTHLPNTRAKACNR